MPSALRFRKLSHEVVILIDRVDEGYEPDELGVALVDALVLAAIDINTRIEQARVVLFLRDNMARAVEQLDPDYSRNIEGQVLRLHWEEAQLFSLVGEPTLGVGGRILRRGICSL